MYTETAQSKEKAYRSLIIRDRSSMGVTCELKSEGYYNLNALLAPYKQSLQNKINIPALRHTCCILKN